MSDIPKDMLREALFALYEGASQKPIVRWRKVTIPHGTTSTGTWVDVRSHQERWSVSEVPATSTVVDLVRERFVDVRVPELVERAIDAGISLRRDDVSLRVRLHVGECATCNTKVTALSVAVAFTVDGILVSREYTL